MIGFPFFVAVFACVKLKYLGVDFCVKVGGG